MPADAGRKSGIATFGVVLACLAMQKKMYFCLDIGTGSAKLRSSCGCNRQSVNDDCNHVTRLLYVHAAQN